MRMSQMVSQADKAQDAALAVLEGGEVVAEKAAERRKAAE